MAEILIIDDDKGVRDLLRAFLEDAGYDVFEASDGDEALWSLELRAPDLVITDVYMPEKDGIDVILELCARHPGVRVLAISGGGTLGEISVSLDSAEMLGAAQTLPKPFTQAQLLKKVEELLASQNHPPVRSPSRNSRV